MCFWCTSRHARIEDPEGVFGIRVDCPCCGKYRMAYDALSLFFERSGESVPMVFSQQQKIEMRVYIFNENIVDRIPTISGADIIWITGAESENTPFQAS